jgi:hypothetical protein
MAGQPLTSGFGPADLITPYSPVLIQLLPPPVNSFEKAESGRTHLTTEEPAFPLAEFVVTEVSAI